MGKLELVNRLNAILLSEMPQHRQAADRFPQDLASQRQILRWLMNLRPPLPLKDEYVALEETLLSAERQERGVIDISALPTTRDPRIALWRGDITRLGADAIVNAANSALLGCFHPGHGCIDNAIHSAAGLRLREECAGIMRKQGHDEPTGQAKITAAYNLPSKFVIHTVGPIIAGELTNRDCDLLAACYHSCLALAQQNEITSIAFCCISTGEYHFPAGRAAEIATHTVRETLSKTQTKIKVIFNVFKESDERIYRLILGENRSIESGD
jgi:O-acetyl-ADP-ribose deacetylase (regulator of RNase III)